MKQWNFGDIISAVNSVPGCTVVATSQAEDYATTQLSVHIQDSERKVYIRGFRTDGHYIAADNNVEMVEVTTGYSDGDMPNDPDYCVKHAEIKAAIMRLGYRVVNSMEGYF